MACCRGGIRYLFNSIRPLRVGRGLIKLKFHKVEISPLRLRFGRKERSDGIASKQMRLVRASMTISSNACRYYIFGHFERSREV